MQGAGHTLQSAVLRESQQNCCLFLLLGDMKLARNDACGNKSHEGNIPAPDQEEMVPRNDQESSCALVGE